MRASLAHVVCCLRLSSPSVRQRGFVGFGVRNRSANNQPGLQLSHAAEMATTFAKFCPTAIFRKPSVKKPYPKDPRSKIFPKNVRPALAIRPVWAISVVSNYC